VKAHSKLWSINSPRIVSKSYQNVSVAPSVPRGVTAEVAGSSPVVPAIHSKELALVSAKPSRTQKGTFSCPFLCPFSLVLYLPCRFPHAPQFLAQSPLLLEEPSGHYKANRSQSPRCQIPLGQDRDHVGFELFSARTRFIKSRSTRAEGCRVGAVVAMEATTARASINLRWHCLQPDFRWEAIAC